MLNLKKIADFLELEVQSEMAFLEILTPRAITDKSFDENSIGWCSDKNIDFLKGLESGTVIVGKSQIENIKSNSGKLNLLFVDQPRLAFSKILQEFFVKKVEFGKIHSSAVVDETVEVDKETVNIGPNVVIEDGCSLGSFVKIGANTVVKSGTVVEDNCSIGSNCTIGGVGFGYEINENQEYELMPHIGNVHLKRNVEIGNNVCIDRAVMGSTILEENVKVDNLVHIAHGVKIGKNSLIIANSMIAGSVEVGENVWISPSSAIRQKLIIGDGALIGLGAIVVKNVDSHEVVAGNPAKPFPKK